MEIKNTSQPQEINVQVPSHNFVESASRKLKNLSLIGPSGVGKSHVGRHLARILHLGFIDIDTEIEKRAKKSIDQIFAEGSEAKFRMLEKEMMAELSSVASGYVVACGAGAVSSDEDWVQLSSWTVPVWLNAPYSTIARRIFMSPDEIRKRPLLAKCADIENKNERLDAIVNLLKDSEGQRRRYYEQAPIVADNGFITPEQVALAVAAKLDGMQRENATRTH